jgi:hypothetical protein
MLRVSVVMPVYNGEKHLREAIDSILAQSFTDFELVMVNDGSTDRGVEIIESYHDPRIRLIENSLGKGVVGARNTGIAHARGEYIAMMDCDDIACPTRLEEQVAFLDAHPDYGMVGADIELIDENNRPTGEVGRYTLASEMIPSLLLFHNYFCQSAVVIRRSVLPEELYRGYPGAEDYDMWVRIARRAKVKNFGKVLVRYRVHPSSLSFVKAEAIDGYVTEIVRYQLEALGLQPTARELEIHRKIGGQAPVCQMEFLQETEEWIMKLAAANARTNVYDNGVFLDVLGKEWYHVCSSCCEMGAAVWRRYWQSSLSRHTTLDLARRSYFFVSSLLRLDRTSAAALKKWGLAVAGRLGLAASERKEH